MALVRKCPACNSYRPLSDSHCQHIVNGKACYYPLMNVMPVQASATSSTKKQTPTIASPSEIRCPNSHIVSVGDFICGECGADVDATQASTLDAAAVPTREGEPQQIGEWIIENPTPSTNQTKTCFSAKHIGDQTPAFLTWYQQGVEPDRAIYDVLRTMDKDHIPDLLQEGRFEDRCFEVFEWITDGTLEAAGHIGNTPNDINRIVDELGRALCDFSEVGLRHRDICPRTILIRSSDPLDLVITDFGSARLSDFDLDAVAPLELTRYSAPEAIVGGVSAASDWWSLGMIVLEQLTQGECFKGINEKAFMIHVVTRGVPIPNNIEPHTRMLLLGLLARDPLSRWQWPEVSRWLKGESVPVPEEYGQSKQDTSASVIKLGDTSYTSPQFYALAAAEEINWQHALESFQSGELATWLSESFGDKPVTSAVRNLQVSEEPSLEWRLALALMRINTDLPLTYQGNIVTPAWLLQFPQEAAQLLEASIADQLEAMKRESWLLRLHYRDQEMREHAKLFEIQLDQDKYAINRLATSRANLDAELDRQRMHFPSSVHPGIASLLDKQRLNEQDIILLLSASIDQFTSISELVEETQSLAEWHQTKIDKQFAQDWLTQTRRDLYAALDQKISGFARCGESHLDQWADDFRLERRIKPARAVLMLSIPDERWVQPDNQHYSSKILSFFHKRMTNSVMRGPLMRLTISKTSSRIDLTEFDTPLCSAESLLNHLLDRNEKQIPVDPEVLQKDPVRENRIWRMVSAATNYRRDTGIDCLYLGFPFLLWSDKNNPNIRPRVAPILLWPVKLEIRVGARGSVHIGFDRGREEVRLNPALEKLVGSVEIDKWKNARKELLGRQNISIQQVADAFGQFAPLKDRKLSAHPPINAAIESGTQQIVCSAVIFNARFSGQAISEDLLQMRNRPLEETALEPIFKMKEIEEPSANKEALAEKDSSAYKKSNQQASSSALFTVVASDPSQEKAILDSRKWPGVVVEGPPGTGKSQTIVNVIADSIGRGEHVLVVCEKQAALKVVEKRLKAENLGSRVLCISDVNRDRQTVIRAIRDQLAHFFQTDESRANQLESERETLAEQIDRISSQLDQRHQHLHKPDIISQLSYKELINQLVTHTETATFTQQSIPALQSILSEVSASEVNILVDEVGSLINDWYVSDYEDSSLKAFQAFSANPAIQLELETALKEIFTLEDTRHQAIQKHSSKFDIEGVEQCPAWIRKYGDCFISISKKHELQLSIWYELFTSGADNNLLPNINSEIDALVSDLNKLNPLHDDKRFYKTLNKYKSKDLADLKKITTKIKNGPSFIDRINPVFWITKSKLTKLLSTASENINPETVCSVLQICNLELTLKSKRSKLKRIFGLLRGDQAFTLPSSLDELDLIQLRSLFDEMADDIAKVNTAVQGISSFPFKVSAKEYLASNSQDKRKEFLLNLNSAVKRYVARVKLQQATAKMSKWLQESEYQSIENQIKSNAGKIALFENLLNDLPALIPFQRHRTRLKTASEKLPEVLASLHSCRDQISQWSDDRRSDWARYIVRKEALEGWKSRIESKHSLLTADQKDLQRLEGKLDQLLKKMQQINRQLLEHGIERTNFGTRTQWRDITGLRGVRYKKLREFFDHGQDIGLNKLRPVWLMNPDVVSQLLPLQAGLFDLVIFDEASQIMVESAVPSLYRAKRVVISGDEKQMPPSSFFNANVDVDEDEFAEELEEDASEAEILQHEETWNRREIKDCPDLLVLGKSVLPTTTLQIHYRSQFRALINFSNSAFYNGQLHVPALNPDHVIKARQPIEVRSVMGCYSNQSNQTEAREIISILHQYWQAPFRDRPSIGVVTFNKKQAELIDSEIQLYSEDNEDFYRAYLQEQERVQNDEDMSFFVKNVENVQGDERDIILFSTTFGRNDHGSFRRNFGALGHRGGERRLNVAVTRARNKVVVVTSMPVREISDMIAADRKPSKPRDYLQAYLDYSTNMSNGEFDAAQRTANRLILNERRTEHSDALKQTGVVSSIRQFVQSLGYSPEPIAGSQDLFRVDLAILDPNTNLYGFGIECDAPNDALLSAAKYRDIWRHNVLKKSIKHIHRINSREWYENNEQEKQRLKTAIDEVLGETVSADA